MIDSLDTRVLKSYITGLTSPFDTWTAVMLTDGETIVGNAGASHRDNSAIPPADPSAELILSGRQFLTESAFIISHTDPYIETSILIPLDKIAGVRTIEVDQTVIEEPLWTFDAANAEERLEQRTNEYLSQLDDEEAAIRRKLWEKQDEAARLWREERGQSLEIGAGAPVEDEDTRMSSRRRSSIESWYQSSKDQPFAELSRMSSSLSGGL